MMLKMLISNWLRDQAKQHVFDVIRDGLEQPAPGKVAPESVPPADIVLLFASSFESGGTVDALKDRVTFHCASHTEHAGELGGQRVAVVESGHGASAAASAVIAATQLHHPRWVIGTGFSSALIPDLRRGHVLMADEVVDTDGQVVPIPLHLDRASLQNNRGLHLGRLLTLDRLPRTPAEREEAARTHRAVASDLETWGAAEACRQGGQRFLAVRVMTEACDDQLPADVDRLLQQRSAAAKLGATARSVWCRPSVAKDLWRFNEDALKASDRLGRFLTGLVQNLPK